LSAGCFSGGAFRADAFGESRRGAVWCGKRNDLPLVVIGLLNRLPVERRPLSGAETFMRHLLLGVACVFVLSGILVTGLLATIQALGLFYSSRGQREKAAAEFQSVLASKPRDGVAKARLIEVLIDLKRLKSFATIQPIRKASYRMAGCLSRKASTRRPPRRCRPPSSRSRTAHAAIIFSVPPRRLSASPNWPKLPSLAPVNCLRECPTRRRRWPAST